MGFWDDNKKLKARIISSLRREFSYSNQRKQALNQASQGLGFFLCAKCQKRYEKDKIHIDHIDPVIDPVKGFTNWDEYINRLFNSPLQALCIYCHNSKTQQENTVRRMKPRLSIYEILGNEVIKAQKTRKKHKKSKK